jgi:hypothetical protein
LPAIALCLFAAAAMLVSPAASGQKGGRVAEEIGQRLASFETIKLDPAEVLRSVREEGSVTLQTARGTFDLEVEPYDVRSADYRAVAAGQDGAMKELARTPSNSWRGRVRGRQGTIVRLYLDGEKLQGLIITPGETFFIEPARDLSSAAGAGEFVFYEASSVKPVDASCEVVTLGERVASEAKSSGVTAAAATGGPQTEEIFAPLTEARIATEADFEFYQKNGNNEAATNADILNIMTQVDGIYEAQLGVRLRVVFQRVWTTDTDPYTLTAASNALQQFATSYNGTFPAGGQPQRELAHMFTGKNLDGTTVGIAYGGVVCDAPTLSYGISESLFSNTTSLRVGVTAHEIGHNFGADHTGPSPNPSDPPVQIPGCDQVGAALMQPGISPAATGFCQFSRDQITAYILGSGGSCLTRLAGGCTYSLAASSVYASAGGGATGVGITTGGGCVWDVAESAVWITPGGSGSGSGTVGFTVAPNSGGPRSTVVDIAGRQLTVKQAAAPACLAAATQIGFGQTLSGSLAASDCLAVAPAGEPERTSAFTDLYTFTGRVGQRVRIEMTSTGTPTLDTYLYLFGPDGSLIAQNDDIVLGDETNSRIPVNGFFTLPATGVYTIEATSFDNGETGSYTLALSDNSAANSVSLSSAAYSVNEGTGGDGLGFDGTGFRVVTVTRSGGDVTGTATVDYATSDGTATRLKDYEQALGTLVFAPNQTSKTFTVFVPDDAFQEGAETVTLTLSNPVGMTLGATTTATLTINSNDGASGSSPVRAQSFNGAFFVRQQYLDFLNREPDASGFNFWQGNITECGADEQCKEVKRINVSAAFFLSIEFQNTGYFVYRTYKAAYGDAMSPNVPGTVPVIRLNEFLPDTQRIGQNVVVGQGAWEAQLAANKQAYALEFVLRPRFLAAFPLSLTSAQFVDKLVGNAGITLTADERNALIAQLDSNPDVAAARAAVLRAVTENQQLQDNEKRRAYVLMQYYGYLRRDPDTGPNTDFTGWKFWLDKLNQFNGDAVAAEMVKAFLSSDEYITRFGN